MKTKNVARHGDLSFRRIESLPENLKPKKDRVLALGEHTGHKHVITVDRPETNLELFTGADGKTYLSIKGGTATVTHEEHKPITFMPGFYQMDLEQEFDYALKSIRTVQD